MATFTANQGQKPGKRVEGFPSGRFGVVDFEIDNVKIAEFTEVSGLQAEVEVFEYQEGGNNLFTHKLPGRAKYPNIKLKHGITENTDLWDWFQEVMYRAPGGGVATSLSIERKNISLVLYDASGAERRRWNLIEAYPVKWTGPTFKADDNAISIEEIELAHRGMMLLKTQARAT